MNQTAKELLDDAVKHDERFNAHAVYYAVTNGFAKLEDPVDSIPFDKLDYDVIRKMRDENMLAMCNIKLFLIRIEPGKFAFYLAKSKDDAQAEHHRMYRELNSDITEMTERMDVTLYCEETKRYESFREIKNRTMQFPCFAGEQETRKRKEGVAA